MPEQQQGSRWVAIVTGAISVAIGVLYLLLITVLDARGPMLPPPAEALAGGGETSRRRLLKRFNHLPHGTGQKALQ